MAMIHDSIQDICSGAPSWTGCLSATRDSGHAPTPTCPIKKVPQAHFQPNGFDQTIKTPSISNNQNKSTTKPTYSQMTQHFRYPTREEAIVLDSISGISVHSYTLASGSLIQPKNVRFVSRISMNRVCLYLSDKSHVLELSGKAVEVEGHRLIVRPLISQARRILISNVCPTITNEMIYEELEKLQVRPVSRISFVRSGPKTNGYEHVMCFRRQMHVKLDDCPKSLLVWKSNRMIPCITSTSPPRTSPVSYAVRKDTSPNFARILKLSTSFALRGLSHDPASTPTIADEIQFFNERFSFQEFNTALASKRESSASGMDGIGFDTIKSLSMKYKLLLLDIYNEMLSQASFPDSWRDVFMIFIGKPSGPGLRPISLTSCFCKLFETLVRNRLQWYAEIDGLKRRSCRGVPQGSVLSPLLYAIYVASVTEGLPACVHVSQFADDLAIFTVSGDSGCSITTLEHSISTLDQNLASRGYHLTSASSGATRRWTLWPELPPESPPASSPPVNFTDLAESFRRDCFTTSIAKCEADGLHKGKIYFDLFHRHEKVDSMVFRQKSPAIDDRDHKPNTEQPPQPGRVPAQEKHHRQPRVCLRLGGGEPKTTSSGNCGRYERQRRALWMELARLGLSAPLNAESIVAKPNLPACLALQHHRFLPKLQPSSLTSDCNLRTHAQPTHRLSPSPPFSLAHITILSIHQYNTNILLYYNHL
ncbi:unnamed protein product [Trichogramma brassicae]|uniref:Reverse transcriptase domain-containing protein n=1 Tax=Trichogramma brassicae TaxID=86971 RepID=A0A6H5J9L2_9HYME|nr:unnamed protein product [Trichogramma brassicae]